MKPGLIRFEDISKLSLADAIDILMRADKIKYSDITLDDLLLSGTAGTLKLKDYNHQKNYGGGVYIFFDNNKPVYVGKAKNFLHRFSSHSIVDVRPNWGWNALLQKICINYMLIPQPDHLPAHYTTALAIAGDMHTLRIIVPDDVKPERLETILMKGIQHQSGTLMNGRIGKVNEKYVTRTLEQLIQA